MPGPLSKIAHKTREVAAALRSNCWYVYHRPAAREAAPQPAPQRVCGARTKHGQVPVRHLATWTWEDVAPADLLYQQ